MVDLNRLFDVLGELGLNFFTGVPDSYLNDFCNYLCANYGSENHLMAANEGNAIAIAAGHYFGTGEIPVVYMQNSGIGNALNPLLSLTHDCVYGIPMVLIIGWRGEPSRGDHAQHKKQGELTPVLLTDMDISYDVLDCEEGILEKFKWAVEQATQKSSPVALIAKKGVLAQKEKRQTYVASELWSREEAISKIIDLIGEDAVYLGTTGRCTRELHAQMQARRWKRRKEFLNVGAMGHLSSVALGIATACRDKRVVVFDGDAALIMHLGSLATAGRYLPSNLIEIVLNNGVNESVGGQKSSGRCIDLSMIAQGCNFEVMDLDGDNANLGRIGEFLNVKSANPKFIDLKIREGIRKDLPKLEIEHKALKEELMRNLQDE